LNKEFVVKKFVLVLLIGFCFPTFLSARVQPVEALYNLTNPGKVESKAALYRYLAAYKRGDSNPKLFDEMKDHIENDRPIMLAAMFEYLLGRYMQNVYALHLPKTKGRVLFDQGQETCDEAFDLVGRQAQIFLDEETGGGGCTNQARARIILFRRFVRYVDSLR
jgi:hypothetical protein